MFPKCAGSNPIRSPRAQAAELARRPVPRAGDRSQLRARRQRGDPRPIDGRSAGLLTRADQGPARRARAHAAPLHTPPRRGAVGPRLALLGARRALRPRLPLPRAGAAGAGVDGAAARAGRADLLASARPLAPALGALSDPRTR